MNRIFITTLAAFTAVFMFASCQKPANNNNNKPADEQKPADETPSDETGISISIDGTFTDWDAVTEAEANKNEYVDMVKGGAGDAIQVFKVVSDPEYINFFIEFKAELLPQNDAVGSWGSSYTEDALNVELGEDDEEFREVMHLFIDPDGDGNTGFWTFADPSDDSGETPAIPGLGSEMCAQFFMCFKPSAGIVNVAFEQTLIGPTKVGAVGEDDQVDENGYTGDYDYNKTICQSWPDDGDEAAFPLWGWQNFDDSGKGDNDCPTPDNWASGKLESNGNVKVEFAILKESIKNLKPEDEELACGIIFDWDEDSYQAIGALRVSYKK